MTLLKHAEKSGNKFLNPIPTDAGGLSIVLKVLPLYLRDRAGREPQHPLGPFVTDPAAFAVPPATGLRVTWFGHSASLIEIDGLSILIDPVWEQRASPAQWFGPKRFFAPTIALADLPKIDVVLVSHDHYDHLGSETHGKLATLPAFANATWVTSLGVGPILTKLGVPKDRIRELDWTDSTEIPGLRITALPTRHFSGRSAFNRFQTLWSSFVLAGPIHRVYYGADSGWWDGFPQIADQYGPFDLTMLEVGAFHELWASIHLGPDNAVRAYQAMGGPTRAGLFMPIHWGLFNLALHPWKQPIQRVKELAAAGNFNLFLPDPGTPTDVTPTPLDSPVWYDVSA